MMISAPLTKSPNCASQATSDLGASTEYPYSKPSAAYSLKNESRTVKAPGAPMLASGTNWRPLS